ALVCTAEVLNMSSIAAPYKLHKYRHPSEVSPSLGNSMGGMISSQEILKDHHEAKGVQNGILQKM
ncbi:hypothetical protein BDM02DRAFT_3105987, partial [Thelephora ganbajun]